MTLDNPQLDYGGLVYPEPVYRRIGGLVQAIRNCEASGNAEWLEKHTETLEKVVKAHMPSGAGFDAGTTLDLAESTPERLVFITAFHHLDESGVYDGWTKHRVIITPSLARQYNVRVLGGDRKGIKEYIGDCFHCSLGEDTRPL
jgi:hypothetical protein